jgi:hypothetical protein
MKTKTKGRMTPKELAAHVKAVWAQKKSIKLTTQEWIEVSMEMGGFRPTPPPFLVKQRHDGKPQQMEFTFDGPKVVAPARRTKERRREEKRGA